MHTEFLDGPFYIAVYFAFKFEKKKKMCACQPEGLSVPKVYAEHCPCPQTQAPGSGPVALAKPVSQAEYGLEESCKGQASVA